MSFTKIEWFSTQTYVCTYMQICNHNSVFPAAAKQDFFVLPFPPPLPPLKLVVYIL